MMTLSLVRSTLGRCSDDHASYDPNHGFCDEGDDHDEFDTVMGVSLCNRAPLLVRTQTMGPLKLKPTRASHGKLIISRRKKALKAFFH